MAEYEGIQFSEQAVELILRLVERLRETGVAEAYGLPRMNGGNGEVRLALYGPRPGKTNARGVFARLIPSKSGVTVSHRNEQGKPRSWLPLTDSAFDPILADVEERRHVVSIRESKGRTSKTPGHIQWCEPGTQLESNRRRPDSPEITPTEAPPKHP